MKHNKQILAAVTAGIMCLANIPLSAEPVYADDILPVGTVHQKIRLGDVNGDNLVNASDAAIVLIAAANIGAGTDSGLTETQKTAADINSDTQINASDAAVILIYAAAVGAGQQAVEDKLADMSVEEKVYQLFIVTPEALVNHAVSTVTAAGDLSCNALQEKPVGGIIYFAQNLKNGEQTKNMIDNMQNFAEDSGAGIGLWIAVDEEGGTVARVAKQLGTTAYQSMSVYGAKGDTDAVFDMGADIAADISQFGFNLDFAPVADVNIHPNNELGNRIFSSDPDVVSDMVSAMVKGLQSTGKVSATLKHFPGLGAEDGNTHYDTAAYINRSYEELTTAEFVSFRGGIDAGSDFVMVGHQIMSCAGDNLPSDLSYTVVTEWLRGDLGFQGVIVTDAHNMNTISGTYTAGTAAKMAVQAGADIILMPTDLNSAFTSVYNAVQNGEIPESRLDESVRRILIAKEKHGLL